MAEAELLGRLLSELDDDTRQKLLLEAEFARRRKKVATAFGTDTTRTAKELRRLWTAFSNPETFVPGQLVTWKPGFKNRRRPVDGEPAIVIEVLDKPVSDEEGGSSSTYFRERLDLKLGLLDEDGDFLFFHFDSGRFTAFTEEKEEDKP